MSEGCLLLELERPIHVSITLDSGVPGVNILQNFPKNIVEKFPHIVKDWGRVSKFEGIYIVSGIDLGKSFNKSSGKSY